MTVSLPYLWAPYPWIQPIMDEGNLEEKIHPYWKCTGFIFFLLFPLKYNIYNRSWVIWPKWQLLNFCKTKCWKPGNKGTERNQRKSRSHGIHRGTDKGEEENRVHCYKGNSSLSPTWHHVVQLEQLCSWPTKQAVSKSSFAPQQNAET